MAFPSSSDDIKLRQRKMLAGSSAPGEETGTTLTAKLNELCDLGYEHDDIYGLVIPLLIQGKVRVELEGRSERLEMEDSGQRLPRTEAMRIFEDFIARRTSRLAAG